MGFPSLKMFQRVTAAKANKWGFITFLQMFTCLITINVVLFFIKLEISVD